MLLRLQEKHDMQTLPKKKHNMQKNNFKKNKLYE